MITIHKIISNLSKLIVFNWAFCYLFLLSNKFYIDNFVVLNIIDTILVSITLIHFFINHQLYKKSTKDFILCIFLIIQLTFLQQFINQEIYYYLYISILLITIIRYVYSRIRKTR